MSERRIYIWQTPVRICHWLNVVLLVTMFASGLYIGWPVLSTTGEASDNALMAWVRYVHFLSGYLFVAVWIFRIYWFFAGNVHSRNIFRFWSAPAWMSMTTHAKSMLTADPNIHQDLPASDQMARFWHNLYFLACAFMVFTGFAMYGESDIHGWAAPVTRMGLAVFGTSSALHYWHHLLAWFFPFFVVAHVYQVVRTDILAHKGLAASMISGYYLDWDETNGNTP